MAAFGWTDEELYIVAERAYGIYLQGRRREAAVLFQGLVAIDPGNSYCVNALASTYIGLGDAAAAVKLLDDFLGRCPGDVDARVRRCEALLELGRLEQARAAWRALGLPRAEHRRLAMRLESAAAATGKFDTTSADPAR